MMERLRDALVRLMELLSAGNAGKTTGDELRKAWEEAMAVVEETSRRE